MMRRLALAAAIAFAPVTAHAQFATIGPTPAVSDNGDRLATTAWVNSLIAGGLTLASGKIWIGSAGNVATPQTPSGDATLALGGALTLATVNANVGSFGSATSCVSFTTNAKGLITAASAVTCTPAISSVTGLGTGVATALGVNVGSAGAPVLFNGAGGTPSSLALANATGLPTTGLTGALQAAQEPAHTGDCTNSAGSLALACTATGGVAFGYGAVTTTSSMTIAAGTGTLTTTSGTLRYQVRGKQTWFQLSVNITTNGTGATSIIVSGLPFTFNSDCAGSGRATLGTGKQIQFYAQSATAALTIWNFDNTYPASTGERLLVNGVCETT